MNTKFSITEVTLREYQNSNPTQKLLESDLPQYFYRINIGNGEYFLNANEEKSRFTVQEVNDGDHLILGSEDRVYIFSLNSGVVKVALRTFDPILAVRILNRHFLIFTEKLMMTFVTKDLLLRSTHMFPDLIEQITINDREVTVVCFENAPKSPG